MTQTLETNIVNLYGEHGKRWLSALPATLAALQKIWQLGTITAVPNMTFHYVGKSTRADGTPVVIKLGCDPQVLAEERDALALFNGQGAIQLLATDQRYHALLLQQAIPGTTLKSLYAQQIETAMHIYVSCMQQMHRVTPPASYRHVTDWLQALENSSTDKIPQALLQAAITLKNKLLATPTTTLFLHGDLHHDNILQHEPTWLAIDPKGILGEAEFEIAAFDFMYVHELAQMKNVTPIIQDRIHQLATIAKLNPNRITAWVFVRLVLMAVWQTNDNSDATWTINLATALSPDNGRVD